jgi:hypothetical protein
LNFALEVGLAVEILPEPENKFDPGAVQVRAHSQKFGNVNRLQAPTFCDGWKRDACPVFWNG